MTDMLHHIIDWGNQVPADNKKRLVVEVNSAPDFKFKVRLDRFLRISK